MSRWHDRLSPAMLEDRWLFLTTSVVLPAFFVLLMTFVESLVAPMDWRERSIKVAWDLCVLALGVVGAVFSDANMVKAYTAPWAVVGGLFSVLLTLACAVCIAKLRVRGSRFYRGWDAMLALALGGAALALPGYLVLKR